MTRNDRPGRRRAARRLVVSALAACLAAAPTAAPGPAAADDTAPSEPAAARVSGGDRFETAARIADRAFGTTDVAVLATARDFPDALAGAFAAGHLPGPVLLVEPDGVPQPTLGMLSELGVTRVVLLGGTEVIGEQVEQDLQEAGYSSRRIGGEDRYATAAQVALAYGRQPGGVGGAGGVRTAILASGEAFPDALSASPLSASGKLPLLLTPRDRRVEAVDFALEALAVERLLVVGGEAAVSSAVASSYEQDGYTVERIAGPDRTRTATAVAQYTIDQLAGFSDRSLLLARGDDFPDALTGGVYGAVGGIPLLLTAGPDTVGDGLGAWLADHCPEVDVVRALGGTAALSASVLAAAVDTADRCTRPNTEVARFQTNLLGNPERTHNLHTAADYIDGDVVAPGATYSLNEHIGRRTRDRGFREVSNGCIGADGEAVDCVGGGISQLGTTFLNTAWSTGVELLEFQQHSLYFARYPVCHESTLNWGTIDVEIRNDSPYDIRIDAFYDDQVLGVRFLSRDWAQVRSWAEPKDPPRSGAFDSRCGRTITYPDGSTDEETYSWRYEGTGF